MIVCMCANRNISHCVTGGSWNWTYLMYMGCNLMVSLFSLHAVPNIIGLTGHTQSTTSSVDVTITYNEDINIGAGVTVDVRGTAIPSDGSHGPIVIIRRGPITGSELRYVFSNLNPGTGYTCIFEAVSRNNPSARIGVEIDLVL